VDYVVIKTLNVHGVYQKDIAAKLGGAAVVDGVEPRPELFKIPFWLWVLLASAMIMGAAGVFLDPRPKQINRYLDIKESALDYFADI
jgi:hypothetical protein